MAEKKHPKNWIQKAVPRERKGLLHKKLGVPEGEKIPAKKMAAAKRKAKSGSKLAKEIQFAKNVAKLGKK
jgi:hypothetical protein